MQAYNNLLNRQGHGNTVTLVMRHRLDNTTDILLNTSTAIVVYQAALARRRLKVNWSWTSIRCIYKKDTVVSETKALSVMKVCADAL